MPKQRVFVLEGDIRPTERLRVHLLHATGLELQTVNAGELEDVVSTDFPKMFQQAHAWACKQRGFVSAFPNFLSEGEPLHEEHRLVMLTADVATRVDATDPELWPHEPDSSKWDVGHFFRVAHDHCARKGLATGFPIFMSTEKDGQRVQHLVALKRGLAIPHTLDLPEFIRAPFTDLPHIFTVVNRWAQERGYVAGIPNFHLRAWGRDWGERTALGSAEQDLNHLLTHEGWRVLRVDPMKLSATRDGLVYLLEKD
jgi:hypothetical protein